MRVVFERSGGFAGRRLRVSVDVESLPGDDAARLKVLLEESGFFDLPQRLQSTAPGPDRFTYRLTVESEEGSRTVEAADAAVPSEMRPLLDWLTRNSRP